MPTYDPTPFGKEVVQSALTGAGVGTSAMALYYLLNRLRPAELPKTLLQDQSAAPLPTAMTPAEKKKKQVKDEELAAKSAAGLNDVYAAIGSAIPTTFNPFAGNPATTAPPAESPTIAHAGWRTAANVAALLGGLYGGRKLVNSMEASKKKKQLAQEVEDARRQYFMALTEKESQALDALYTQLTEKTAAPQGGGLLQQQVIGPASDFTKNYVGIPLWRALLMTGLGTGALGAHYMYNRTKDTSQSRNLQRAQKARARLKALQETPWVDPAELEALSAAAK